jgi:general secretion pathway protein B
MSYILDALKKSEQNRSQGEVPGLNSFQNQPRPPRSTSRIILYLLIATLLINALVLGVWVISRQPEAPLVADDLPGTIVNEIDQPLVENVAVIGSAEIVTESTPAPTITAPAETTSQTEPEDSGAGSIPITEPATAVADIVREEPLPDDEVPTAKLIKYNSLPTEVRSELGTLGISAHYYANTPSTRMASINGRIMRQGESVKDDLVLEKITRKGVIFTFRKYRFSMDVFNH